MKKILSVLVILAAVCTMAFAEVSAAINYRTQMDAYNLKVTKDANGKSVKASETFGQKKYGGPNDVAKFSITGDNLGATFAFNTDNTDNNDFEINTLNMYIKVWNLNFEYGIWKDGTGNTGSYRVSNDAGNWAGNEFERWKLGSLFKNGSLFIDSLATIDSGKPFWTFLTTYTQPIAEGCLKVKASIMTGDQTSGADVFPGVGFGGIVEWDCKPVQANYVYKTWEDNKANRHNVMGLYAKPKMVKGLNMTIGGSLAFVDYDKETETNKDGLDGFSLEARARYAITKPFSVTGMFNFSTSKTVGKLGAKLNSTDKAGEKAMWAMIAGKYVINDAISARLSFGTTVAFNDEDTDDFPTCIRITPGFDFTAGKNAVISIGCALGFDNLGTKTKNDEITTLAVPCIFRVRL